MSASREKRRDGSSSMSLWSATEILSSSPLDFGSIAKAIAGSGMDRRREDERLLLRGEGIARERLLELGDASDVARGDFGHGLHRLAEGGEDGAEALGRLARGVPVGAVALERARDDPKERQAPGVRVGDRLEDERGGGAGRVGGQGLALPGLVLGDGLEGVGRRQQIHDLVEELLDARLVVAARGEQDRRDLAVADRLREGGLHLLLGEVALGEERLHELVVALGDHLDERLVQGRGVLRELLGDGARRRLAGGVGQVALHGHEVDDAAEGLLASDGRLEADAGAAELAGKLLHDAAAVRVLAVHPVDDHEAGEAELVAELPGFLRLDLDAGDGVHDEERGVRGACRPQIISETKIP